MSIYLDHNASTPLLPEALEGMITIMQSSSGNASSLHKSGRFLRSAIETARGQLAALVNCDPGEIIFTSGGTEANNLAIKGVVEMGPATTIITSRMEHASVLEPVIQAQQMGCKTHYFKTDHNGSINLESAQELVNKVHPDLISLQMANNETGVLQPVQALANEVSANDILVHTDATQVAGKMKIDIDDIGADLMSMSAHKFYGPQGVGALILKNGRIQNALLAGGPQEAGHRAGTENTALIVGMGIAAEIAHRKVFERQAFLLELRRYFEQQLSAIPGVVIFGDTAERLPNTSFFSIPYYHGETLLMELDRAGFELASGSACHSKVTQPSHVLSAMGIDESIALNAVRVSFGIENNRQQIDDLISKLNQLINQLPAVIRQAAG